MPLLGTEIDEVRRNRSFVFRFSIAPLGLGSPSVALLFLRSFLRDDFRFLGVVMLLVWSLSFSTSVSGSSGDSGPMSSVRRPGLVGHTLGNRVGGCTSCYRPIFGLC